MSSISRGYTFSDGTGLIPSQVESEIKNIVTTWNNHDQGILSWTVMSVAGDITITGPGNGTVLTTPDGLHTYRIAIANDGVITTEQVT